MAIDTEYATVAQYQAATGLQATPTDLAAQLKGASRVIEKKLGQIFNSYSATLEFNGHGLRELFVPPLQAVTTLKFDENDDGTYETTIAAGDFVLLPLDAPDQAQAEPYSSIMLRRSASRSVFPKGLATVEIVGTWGWAAVPDAIRDLCISSTYDYRASEAVGPITESSLLGTLADQTWRAWRDVERSYSRRAPAMAD